MRSLRTVLGLVLAGSVLRFWLNGWAEDHFPPGAFAFHYYGLGWVPHPGRLGLQLLQGVQLAGALALLYRPWVRLGAVAFLVAFLWTFSLDATWYLNHYYFIALVVFGLAVVPGTDGGARQYTVAWFRLQAGILYVCAGLFKIEPDWLLHAQPLRIWLAARSDLPLIGPMLAWPVTAWVFSWGGMLYDTAIPFLLMNRRTRWPAYALVIVFHGLVGVLFDIGIFPWVMVGIATVFFSQDVHERFWGWADRLMGIVPKPFVNTLKPLGLGWGILFGLWFGFHILFPFRYLLYPGSVFWHEQGFRFSWRVMLMDKVGTATFYVQNARGGWGMVNNREFLTPVQERMMATQPDFILQYARFLSERFSTAAQPLPAVRGEIYVTLNGRPSRLFVKPEVDLSRFEDGWAPYTFLEVGPE